METYNVPYHIVEVENETLCNIPLITLKPYYTKEKPNCKGKIVSNPFDNLLDMVKYYLAIYDRNNIEELIVYADSLYLKNVVNKYPKHISIDVMYTNFIVPMYISSHYENCTSDWMRFNYDDMDNLLRHTFFDDYFNAIFYPDIKEEFAKRSYCYKDKCGQLTSGKRKYSFLEVYLFAKMQVVAAQKINDKYCNMIWYVWFYLDMIDEIIKPIGLNHLIADLYMAKGRQWIYTNKYGNVPALDPVLYKWACYGIEACQYTGRYDDMILKKEILDLYSEYQMASITAGKIIKDDIVAQYIIMYLQNYDSGKMLQLRKQNEKLAHENYELKKDKETLFKSVSTLKNQIVKLQTDLQRSEYEKAEAIAKRIICIMPNDAEYDYKAKQFFEIWLKLSVETRKQIKTAISLSEYEETVELAIFLQLRCLERELKLHFFEPFKKSLVYNNIIVPECSNEKLRMTTDVLYKKGGYPTLGNIPFIGRAIMKECDRKSSNVINAFAEFLGDKKENFAKLAKDLDTYRVGIQKFKLVELRNAVAHNNEAITSLCDKTHYDDVVTALCELPVRILVATVLNSKLQ